MPSFNKFQQVVVIVSSGRTGTTALAQHLDRSYDNVRALHEPRPSWRLRVASAKALCGRMNRGQLADLLTRSRRSLVEKIDKPIYIESNPFLQGFIEALGDVFANLRVVHVVRDPRTYVRSSVNFGAMRGIKYLASTFYPYWLPKPDHFPNRTDPLYRDMHPAERMAWFWKTVNQDLLRGEQIYGPNYLRIKFEDLFAKDGSGLNLLTDWVGLPRSTRLQEEANKERVNASRGTEMPRWEQWDPELQKMLLRHCGELMKTFGYPTDLPSPATPPSVMPSQGVLAH